MNVPCLVESVNSSPLRSVQEIAYPFMRRSILIAEDDAEMGTILE